ncbi:MAG: GIY-YIG nuclease family protein [Flavobacteriales bacterium]|nr:GIY-YIG nuclease family protein [Flavobacteriales bacterium]
MNKLHCYWVYIVTNKGRTVLYTGVTNNVHRRLFEHRTGCSPDSFAYRYQCWTLVYMKEFQYIQEAIAYESRLKNWKRSWKEELITGVNPDWCDLSKGWDYTGWYDPRKPPRGFYTQHRIEAWGGPEDQR